MFGYGLLEVGDEALDFGMGVVSEHGVDGFVYVGRGALCEGGGDEEAREDDQGCELGADLHSVSMENVEY